VGLFGESVSSFEPFWLSSAMGRFTLPEWLGLSTGTVVLLVTSMALAMFGAGEVLERRFGGGDAPRSSRRLKYVGSFALLAASLVLVVRGEPSAAERWQWASPQVKRQLEERAIFASPAEVIMLRKDTSIQVTVLDLRNEHDFNLFHIGGSRRIARDALAETSLIKELLEQPKSSVTFLVGNGEAAAQDAWQGLAARGVQNLYVVEGGINRWLELYPVPACVAHKAAGVRTSNDELAYRFAYATGDRLPSAWPELSRSKEFRSPCDVESTASRQSEDGEVVWPEYPFTRRVKLQVRSVVKGGCG
jgi:hypothetical protein